MTPNGPGHSLDISPSAPAPTLGPTTLVHEFYLKASGLRDVDWESRGQFIAAAARAMRNLLVDNARRRMSEKHGGGRVESLGDNDVSVLQPEIEVLAVNEALDKLATEYPRHARIVELIFFGGLSAAEVSEAEKPRIQATACRRGFPKHPQRLSATGKGEQYRLEMYVEIGDIRRDGRRPMESTTG